MMINVAWPIIEFLIWFNVRFIKRCFDKRWSFSTSKTHCENSSEYYELYKGPQYFIHYKYSFIMNIVFITFMFGAGMPILFPIAFVALSVLYVMERLLIAYSYT
jgi:hypothetical protein